MLSASASLDLMLGELGALVFTHREASVGDVGRNYLCARELRKIGAAVPRDVGLVVVQTCNRIELYFYGRYSETLEKLVGALRSLGKDVGVWRSLRGAEAVHHLFRVAAGLESLSVGENEILGQVRDAYNAWRRRGRVGRELSVVFERAIRVGRRVRRETAISRGKVGLYSLAVEYASQRADLLRSRVCVVGAGEVSSKIAKMLHDMGAAHVTILNRTVSRAQRVAAKYGYSHGPLVLGELGGFDVVFAAISRPAPVQIEGPRLVVDLSVPPAFLGQNVVHLEDLRSVAERNAVSKLGEIKKAEAIVAEEEEKLARQLRERLADEYIARIMGRVEKIRLAEVKRALGVLRNRGVGSQLVSDVLDAMSRAIVNKTFYRVLEDIRLLTYQGDMEHVEYLLSLFAQEDAGRSAGAG